MYSTEKLLLLYRYRYWFIWTLVQIEGLEENLSPLYNVQVILLSWAHSYKGKDIDITTGKGREEKYKNGKEMHTYILSLHTVSL